MKFFKSKKRLISIVLSLIGIELTFLLALICNKYFDTVTVVIVATVFDIIWCILIAFSRSKAKITTIVNVILIVVLLIANIVALRISSFSGNITNLTNTDTVSVVTVKDSDITLESDFVGLRLATVADEESYTEWAIKLLQDADKYTGVVLQTYETNMEAFKALLNGEADLMVMSSDSEYEILESEDETLTIREYAVLLTDSVDLETEALPTVDDVSQNGFTVLINGVDLSGNNINKKARADVNILATVNPSTGKINLQVLPRDLWVKIPCRNNKKSKLTRSGSLGGSSCTIDAIEQYFDHEVEINYYAKINFTGLIDLIDALGGITAYSRYDYCADSSVSRKRYCFYEGNNKMNGDKALTFARVRKILPGNDLARGNNQLEIIKGIIAKFSKNPSLESMNAMLDAIEGNFVTSFDEKTFVNLFNLFLSIKDKMTIESNSMKGDIVWDYDPIYKQDLYYFVPDKGQKEKAVQRIKDTLEGK